MRRREFLCHTAVAGLAALWPSRSMAALSKVIIRDIEIWRLSGKRTVEPGHRGQSNCQPIHVYPELRPRPAEENPPGKGGEVSYSATYLKIVAEDGLFGLYGPIDSPAAVVIQRQLAGFLKGKDALAGEMLWDQLFRLNRHSRAGHFMMAISAVDNALWDLRGRYFNQPVYRLLGGNRSKVDVYGSTLGYSVEPEAARQTAAQLKAQGFVRQKWFPFYGPSHGREGLLKNIDLAKSVRQAMGHEGDMMFDAFMGWDYNYAIQWAKAVEHLSPRWLEEPFHPDKVGSFAQLSDQTSIPIASGEHFYGRWEVTHFLEKHAIQVVQADPEWCGGVSELVKMCAIASAFDAHVIPHGHNLHAAMHVVASQSPMTCPLVEFLIQKMSYYYMFEKYVPTPVNGVLSLPETPGFGIEFNEAVVDRMEKV